MVKVNSSTNLVQLNLPASDCERLHNQANSRGLWSQGLWLTLDVHLGAVLGSLPLTERSIHACSLIVRAHNSLKNSIDVEFLDYSWSTLLYAPCDTPSILPLYFSCSPAFHLNCHSKRQRVDDQTDTLVLHRTYQTLQPPRLFVRLG